MKKTVRVLSAVLILTALIGLLGGGLTVVERRRKLRRSK